MKFSLPNIALHFLILVLALVPVRALAYHPKDFELVRNMVKETFFGADIDELTHFLGKPTMVLYLPGGRRAFAYKKARSTHTASNGRRCIDSYVIDRSGTVVSYYCR